MLAEERQAWSSGCVRVVGVDEAGRGPLAGPVCAAAVCFPADFFLAGLPTALQGLTDSKKLSASQRGRYFDLLIQLPDVDFGIAFATEAEIDEINILQATWRAMQRAVEAMKQQPDLVLVDGPHVPKWGYPSKPLVGGDGRSLSIAAASVLAKVSRDREMLELDRRYPNYGFARHKGYGTKAHLEALHRWGPSPCHRRSFRGVLGGCDVRER